jgi:NTE family protein
VEWQIPKYGICQTTGTQKLTLILTREILTQTLGLMLLHRAQIYARITIDHALKNQEGYEMRSFSYRSPKIGLALSGGAARGIAHIGALKAIEEESIPISMIAGTSAGALIGACYARRRNFSALEDMALRADWRMVARLVDIYLILLGKGFVHEQKIKSILKSIIGDVNFEDLEIPLAVVAADLQSMEEVVISKGPVLEGVRASISMPVMFPPARWGNRFLIDGGVVNPLPVNVVRNMGANIVVAVNVLGIAQPRKVKKRFAEKAEMRPSPRAENTHSLSVEKNINRLVRGHKDRIKIFDKLSRIAETKIYAHRSRIDRHSPSIFYVLGQLIHAMEHERMKLAIRSADIVISPDVSNIGTFGVDKAGEAIVRGYKAAKDILPQLQEMIRCSQDTSRVFAQD